MAREHTVEDYLELRLISSAEISPDGSALVFATSRTYREKGKTMEGSIVIRSLGNPDLSRELFEADTRNYAPAISPEGKRIAYLQKRDKLNSLVIYNIDNGQDERIILGTEPSQISWLDDGSIAVLMAEAEKDEIKRAKEAGDDGFYFEEEEKYSSIYIYRPGQGFQRITEGIQVWEFSVSGKSIVFVGSDLPTESSWYHSSIYKLRIGDNNLEKVYTPEWRTVARPRMSADNKKIAFLESLWSDRGVVSGDILVTDIATGKTVNTTENHDRSYSDMHWSGDGMLHAVWTRDGSAGFATFNGKWEYSWSSEGTVYPPAAPEFSLHGKDMVFAYTDAGTPLEVFRLEPGSMNKLTSVNDRFGELKKYSTEVVRWKSTDGVEVYGVLKFENRGNPLIVNVHGGPTSFSPVVLVDKTTPFIGRGYSVFYPNYRGSIGRGRKYAEANRGDMGGMDLLDIISGVDYLRKSGKVQTDAVFITGGSYGGFMTSWAITQTDMFRAAVGLFGIADWMSFHGVTNIPDWDSIHYAQSPYMRDLFEKFSPINYVEKVKTPVLLQHGVDDPCVPVGQYHQFYRALKDLGKTVRLLLFPREGHGFLEKKHILMQFNETLNWYEKFRKT